MRDRTIATDIALPNQIYTLGAAELAALKSGEDNAATKILTLNTELLDLPRDLGEFVIVHELVHLLCPNSGHGRLFNSFMMAYLPDWEVRERRLRQFTENL